MAEIKISTGLSGRLTAAFLFRPYLVSKVKSIEGYRWHPKEKYWSFPNSIEVLKALIRLFRDEDIQIDPELISEYLDMFSGNV